MIEILRTCMTLCLDWTVLSLFHFWLWYYIRLFYCVLSIVNDLLDENFELLLSAIRNQPLPLFQTLTGIDHFSQNILIKFIDLILGCYLLSVTQRGSTDPFVFLSREIRCFQDDRFNFLLGLVIIRKIYGNLFFNFTSFGVFLCFLELFLLKMAFTLTRIIIFGGLNSAIWGDFYLTFTL